eukprot:1800079-Rhodomonas_salina.2
MESVELKRSQQNVRSQIDQIDRVLGRTDAKEQERIKHASVERMTGTREGRSLLRAAGHVSATESKSDAHCQHIGGQVFLFDAGLMCPWSVLVMRLRACARRLLTQLPCLHRA